VVIGAAAIGPRYRPPSNIELPLPRSLCGNQRRIATMELGQSADCPTPSSARMVTNEVRLKPSGVAAVSTDHKTFAQYNMRRGPKRSASQPAGT
jgi:hypothetical protein